MPAMAPEPVDIPIEGGSLRLWAYGDTGPALLWCHGAGLCGRAFEPLFARIAPRHFRIAALDLNGHGHSTARQALHGAGWEPFRQDIADAAACLEKRFGLIGGAGHSGGGAALAMEQIRTGRFPRLALLDPILAPDHFFPAANPLAEGARRRRHRFSSRDEARARLGPKYPYSRWEPGMFEAYIQHGFREEADGSVTLRCSGEVEAAFYLAGSTWSTLQGLSALGASALIITGSDSYMEPFAELQWRHAPAGSRLELLPNCGHFIAQERPDDTARLIREWLGVT